MNRRPRVVSSTAWYDTPLYYDIVYQDYTRPETRFLEAVARRHGPTRRGPLRVLEPACGSGRLVESLARRGHVAHGFDLNPNMLRHARARLAKAGLRATLWRDRLESFRAPGSTGFDLAHCLVSTFKYILTEAGARSHLRRVAAALSPGGLYVLGLHLTDYGQDEPDHERWVRRRGAVRVTSETWSDLPDRRSRIEACRTRMRISDAGRRWVEETVWDFRTYSSREMRRLLRSVPELELVACHDFHYSLRRKRRIEDGAGDIVLVLRRRV